MQGKQIRKGYLGVYQKEKVICYRRMPMEVEIDVGEVRKLERNQEVGNCVNKEVGISGSGNIGIYEDCVMNNSKGK